MPRKMSPEREKEYAELNAFLNFYTTNVSGIDPADPIHSTNVGKHIVSQFGKSKALDGLKQAVNDTVEELIGQSPEYIQQLDSTLREAGLLTFSEVWRRYGSSYKRTLKRRKIKNETEFYLISGVLATSSVSNEERELLGQLVSKFEHQAEKIE